MKKSLGARTIIFPTPVLIVATYDPAGRPNAMAAAWGGICCSDPPCVAVSLREATYTYGNLMARKAFTINIPSEEYLREADYLGLVSGRNVEKFPAAGLTPAPGKSVDAPVIEEFPLVLECALLKSVRIGLHTQFIGEIKDVRAETAVLDAGGNPGIGLVKPLIFDPAGRAYYGIGPRLGQAFAAGKSIGAPPAKEGRC
ncbi:MAG TPA: flavin reductase family protein [bacterium]|uniref:Flavoredoxin n=1 Tax=candidate division TA06 bacterium ADurb.Bin417 TaxID=1852828 RepID=A0A1V5ML40_UNCT6|nr:MAG: Flavoredoxin [candidate division TA06 bacterium ADurb.Bin417]HNQ34880.1 flavin reductase family protein [bacterium]HNS48493.1 flavin reductase family protein [bacterium]